MKYNFLIIVVILFSCNLNQQQAKPKAVKINNDKCHVYPQIILTTKFKRASGERGIAFGDPGMGASKQKCRR
jgi:hypothetical protein